MTMSEESVQWLLDRLPPGMQPTRRVRWLPSDRPYLSWESGPRALDLTFETPHRVRFDQYDMIGLRDDQTSGPPVREGSLLVSMNIAEITDLVRWAVEGK